MARSLALLFVGALALSACGRDEAEAPAPAPGTGAPAMAEAPAELAPEADLSAQAAEEILAADRAFNTRAQAEGLGPAFGAFMDENGLAFESSGAILRGGAAIAAARTDNIVPSYLTWEPQEAFASKAGDFGASWGTWRWDETPSNPQAGIATGKYVTVWRKDEAGAWKGIMDIGVSDMMEPQAGAVTPGLDAPASALAPGGDLVPPEVMPHTQDNVAPPTDGFAPMQEDKKPDAPPSNEAPAEGSGTPQ